MVTVGRDADSTARARVMVGCSHSEQRAEMTDGDDEGRQARERGTRGSTGARRQDEIKAATENDRGWRPCRRQSGREPGVM